MLVWPSALLWDLNQITEEETSPGMACKATASCQEIPREVREEEAQIHKGSRSVWWWSGRKAQNHHSWQAQSLGILRITEVPEGEGKWGLDGAIGGIYRCSGWRWRWPTPKEIQTQAGKIHRCQKDHEAEPWDWVPWEVPWHRWQSPCVPMGQKGQGRKMGRAAQVCTNEPFGDAQHVEKEGGSATVGKNNWRLHSRDPAKGVGPVDHGHDNGNVRHHWAPGSRDSRRCSSLGALKLSMFCHCAANLAICEFPNATLCEKIHQPLAPSHIANIDMVIIGNLQWFAWRCWFHCIRVLLRGSDHEWPHLWLEQIARDQQTDHWGVQSATERCLWKEGDWPQSVLARTSASSRTTRTTGQRVGKVVSSQLGMVVVIPPIRSPSISTVWSSRYGTCERASGRDGPTNSWSSDH